MANQGFTTGPLPNEKQLIDAAKRDFRHFEPLYDHYYEQIFRFVFRRSESEAMAADLVSQVFFKALGGLKNFKYTGVPFGAWLHRIAANEVKKYYRNKGTRQILSLEEDQVKELIAAEEEEEAAYKLSQLVDFLKELEEEELMVVELRFFEEKGFKEIAYILGLKESTVKMRTYRTLDKLRQLFKININD
ncbi:MAG: sigma-70 family RNA polymerase sigma factor [Cyclobacteriaceae bacterium]